MKTILSIVILSFLTLVTAQTPSPCPDIFSFDTTRVENNRWFGELTLDSEFPLIGVWIRVILDRKAELVGSTFNEVVSYDNKEFLIKNRDYTLIPGQPLKVQFFVKYSEIEPIPNLVSVRLNGRTVCPAKQTVLISQCPGILSYDLNGITENQWTANINIDNEFELQGIWMRVILDRPAELIGNEFGEITTTDNTSYLIKNRNYTLKPGQPLKIPIWVKYDTLSAIPAIKSIRLNGRTICDQSLLSGLLNANGTLQLGRASLFGISNELDTSHNSEIACGTVIPDASQLIVQGQKAKNSQWPWHGAIYETNKNYICGMSLVSEIHAVTAAHCVTENISSKKLRNPKTLSLYFGLNDRRKLTDKSVQKAQAKNIVIHPEYNVYNIHNDVAVIKFEKPVQFNNWVRPICLWEGDIDIRNIVNRAGTVVGFGVTETEKTSEELLYAPILVVDPIQCIYSNPSFYSIYTSPSTFCAGNLTESAVCNGDSGGGMVFKKDGTDIWHLRGIVSNAVRKRDTLLCDNSQYAIFTDVAKHLTFINKALEN